ncbi:hypothetical protein V3G39_03285 [Dermatophilaceae bacterium Sec6.4]
MSSSRRFAISVGVGVLAAGATIGAAASGHASTPTASSTSAHTGAYLNIDPHISVKGDTINVGATISGKVRAAQSRYPDTGVFNYDVTVNGKDLGGSNPAGSSPCLASALLVPYTQTEPALSVTSVSLKNSVKISVTYCGDNGKMQTSTITREVPLGQANPSDAYLDVDPLITVQNSSISVAAVLSGKVYAKNSADAEADLGSYQVLVDGKVVGGADAGSLQCTQSDPLVAVRVRRDPITTSVSPGQHVVTITQSFCGVTDLFLTSKISRTVTVGSKQQGPSQPPTPSAPTTHLGVTG